MNQQICIILLVAGTSLLIWGFNLFSQVLNFEACVYTGSPTDKALINLIAACTCEALGTLQLNRKSRRTARRYLPKALGQLGKGSIEPSRSLQYSHTVKRLLSATRIFLF